MLSECERTNEQIFAEPTMKIFVVLLLIAATAVENAMAAAAASGFFDLTKGTYMENSPCSSGT